MAQEPTSTLPEDLSASPSRRGATGRRVFAVLLVAFLVAMLLGAAGPASGTVSAEGPGYRLTVEYPARNRAGLAAPWRAVVERTDGDEIDHEVTVAVTSSWLALFDENGIDPEPAEATADGELTRWTFAPPFGPRLEVSLDMRVQPGVHLPEDAVVRLLVDDQPVTEVAYTTVLVP